METMPSMLLIHSLECGQNARRVVCTRDTVRTAAASTVEFRRCLDRARRGSTVFGARLARTARIPVEQQSSCPYIFRRDALALVGLLAGSNGTQWILQGASWLPRAT